MARGLPHSSSLWIGRALGQIDISLAGAEHARAHHSEPHTRSTIIPDRSVLVPQREIVMAETVMVAKCY